MKSLDKFTQLIKKPLLLSGAIFCLLMRPGLANEVPFAIDGQGWRSMDRYGETKPGQDITPGAPGPTNPASAVAEPPKAGPGEETDNAVKPQIRSTSLPGVQTQFDIRIDSTSDDHAATTEANEVPTGEALSKAAWQDPKKFLEQRAGAKLSVEEDDEGRRVNIRLPLLPSGKVVPSGASALKQATDDYSTSKKTKLDPIAAAPVAACAGNSAGLVLKKKQLAAIDSDRQTLAALKAAITELKAEKELGFMTNVSGSLAASAPMDLPSQDSLLTTLKN
jgi:hypothetical protein